MISFSRGDEPAELTDIRTRKLADLNKHYGDTAAHPTNTIIKWSSVAVVRKALWQSQRMKCCYCEEHIFDTHEPIEHHRPKSEAIRLPGCSEEHGYWWLTYTWENLLLSCMHCNSKKLSQFPLAAGSVVLDPGVHPPGSEKPLLIDPATECGARFIQFYCQRRGARDYWYPQPRQGISEHDYQKAEWTIRVCGIRAQGMLNKYVHWVESAVKPQLESITAALEDDNSSIVKTAVVKAQQVLLNPTQRFVALSYDALVHYTSAKLAPLGYSWPMPQ